VSKLNKYVGQNCNSKCIIEICQDAEADVALGQQASTINTHERVLSGERPVENKELKTSLEVIDEAKPVDLDSCAIWHGIDVHAEELAKVIPKEVSFQNDKAMLDNLLQTRYSKQSGREKKRPRVKERFRRNNDDLKEQALKAMSMDPSLNIKIPGVQVPPVINTYEKQSGVPNAEISVSGTSAQMQNISFKDFTPSPSYEVPSYRDETRTQQDCDDTDLGNFFSRPIKIREYEWGTGLTLAQDFNPWQDYFENPRVINRLTNFNLLSANLKLKIIVNGNGFQYGRALMAYNPLDSFDEFSTHSALVPADLVQTSQLPHIYIDPTTSQGGELKLPFFYYKNYMSIPDADWREMGQVYLRSLNALKHANGATDQVTISVFAHAEDIQMSSLTNVDATGLTPQSGKEVDEANSKGVVSGPATAIAKVAKVASGIGAIAPYAMATEKVATMVAGVARALGYCSPPITKAPDPYKPYNTASLANTTVPAPVNKLTVDDKQELTIDPRIAGIGPDDPMNIRDIAKRESYLTTFDWDVGTSPETLLWNSRVCPVTWAETGLTPASQVLPACAMAALPFEYWTGTMRFRFQVVCSNFHKGRLKLVYDPNHIDTVEYNTNSMKIVDISEEQDFTIDIGVAQPENLLLNPRLGSDSVTEIYSSTPYTGNAGFGNGTLSLYIVNELTVPNSSIDNNIQINVFVSMGDDFEVFVPSTRVLNSLTFFAPQSGVELGTNVPDAQRTEEPSHPLQDQSETIGLGEQTLTNMNKVFTGEAITSFRPLLKRDVLWGSYSVPRTDKRFYALIRCMFPAFRGFAPDAVHDTSTDLNYNYFNTLLLHWVTQAHQGHRGGIRWKFLPRLFSRNSSGKSNFHMQVSRNYLGYGQEYADFDTASVFTNVSAGAWSQVSSFLGNFSPVFVGDTLNGTAYTNNSVNDVMDVEIPYYSNFRFSPGKEASYTGIETFDATMRISFTADLAEVTSGQSFLDMYCSTAEDYQVYFWTGLPRVYYEIAPPTPAA
jgi:hypothetical protein